MVSSVSGTTSSYSSYNGISGLVSGLDTESLVKKLLGAEEIKVETLKAKKQTTTWQQEAYQEVITKLSEFSDQFYDVLNTESNMLSSAGSKTVNFSNESQTSSQFVDIVVNSDALLGSHTINEVAQLATVSSVMSSANIVGGIKGSVDLTSLSFPLDYSDGQSFRINLDGSIKEVNLSGHYLDADDLVTDINSQLEASLGIGRVIASLSDDHKLAFTAPNSIIQISSSSDEADFLESVGIASGSRNILSLDQNANTVFGETAQTIAFKINDVPFIFENWTSFRTIISEVNHSEANVNLSYSTLNDTFTLTSKNTGESSVINIENYSGDFFGDSSYIHITDSVIQNGKDAVFYIDDTEKTNPIKRSSNSFTVDGVTFSLKAVTSEEIDYTIVQNTNGIFDKIKNYISSFNELFDGIHDKLNDKVNKDYKPLTEAQKAEMTETQIELWEEKAKSGILRRDPLLMKLESDMKRAFWDQISGISTDLYDIGLSTSSNYNNFEIEINETKLKAAINDDLSEVLSLFNKEEDIQYSATLSSSERATRYQEIGFAQRISDIINYNVSTLRDSSGQKGLLVEKAGIDGDVSEVENALSKQLATTEERIATALEKMKQKEQYYWSKFTAMEKAIQQMNSQSDWIYSQFVQPS